MSKENSNNLLRGLICVAIGAIIWCIPAPAGVGPQAWGLLAVFVGARMPAARVRPHPRPGALGERAARDQQPSVGVEQVARERQMQRRVVGVHAQPRGRSDRPSVLAEQHDGVIGHRAVQHDPSLGGGLMACQPVPMSKLCLRLAGRYHSAERRRRPRCTRSSRRQS